MQVITDFEYCYDSPDYKDPIGAKYDDTTNIQYILDIEKYFDNKKLTTLELGCAGGRIVMDLIKRGHNSYGLEGTPYPREISRPAWVNYYKKNLFNCDLSKPFQLLDDNGKPMQFDLISHWEFLEHISTNALDNLLLTLCSYLKPDGIMLCGISPYGPTTNGRKFDVEHHQSCFFKEEWEEKYFNKLFTSHPYPFEGKLRVDWNDELNLGSFNTMLKKKI
jgi:hypothetical protein